MTLLYDEDPWPATITEIDPAQGLLTVRFEDGSLEPNPLYTHGEAGYGVWKYFMGDRKVWGRARGRLCSPTDCGSGLQLAAAGGGSERLVQRHVQRLRVGFAV